MQAIALRCCTILGGNLVLAGQYMASVLNYSLLEKLSSPVSRGARGQSYVTHLIVHRHISLRVGKSMLITGCRRTLHLFSWHFYTKGLTKSSKNHAEIMHKVQQLHSVSRDSGRCTNKRRWLNILPCSSKTAAAYVNRQRGVRSAQLLSIARQLLDWAHTHLFSIRAVYISSELNTAASQRKENCSLSYSAQDCCSA